MFRLSFITLLLIFQSTITATVNVEEVDREDSQIEWGFAKGGGICAASNNVGDIFIGELNGAECTSIDTAPSEYIKINLKDLVLIKKDATSYLGDSSLINVVYATKDGHQHMELVDSSQDYKYSFSTAGAYFGGQWQNGELMEVEDQSYGYLGTASYLMQEGVLEFSTNSFQMSSVKVEDVCIIELDSDAKCTGTKNEAKAGMYKFSLYGRSGGKGYQKEIEDNQYEYLGIRQVLDFSKMSGVTINDKLPSDIQGTDKIEIITIQDGGSDKFALSFKQKYNWGTIDGANVTLKGTEDVIIHAFPDKDNNKLINIDYVFKMKDQLDVENAFFVYDPEISFDLSDLSDSSQSILFVSLGLFALVQMFV